MLIYNPPPPDQYTLILSNSAFPKKISHVSQARSGSRLSFLLILNKYLCSQAETRLNTRHLRDKKILDKMLKDIKQGYIDHQTIGVLTKRNFRGILRRVWGLQGHVLNSAADP